MILTVFFMYFFQFTLDNACHQVYNKLLHIMAFCLPGLLFINCILSCSAQKCKAFWQWFIPVLCGTVRKDSYCFTFPRIKRTNTHGDKKRTEWWAYGESETCSAWQQYPHELRADQRGHGDAQSHRGAKEFLPVVLERGAQGGLPRYCGDYGLHR